MARYQVDERLLNALIQQESRGNNNAVSPKGALGLAQVMPATARNPGFGVQPLRSSAPEEQVRFANDYLGSMLDRYNGNTPMALAAYNAGPGAVDKAGGVPNYPETQNYVKKILTSLNPISDASAEEIPDPQEWVKQYRASKQQSQQAQQEPQADELPVNIPDPQEWVKQYRASKQTQQKGIGERALESLPGDIENIGQGTIGMVAHPIDTAKGLASVARGAMQSALPDNVAQWLIDKGVTPDSRPDWNALADSYKKDFGSLEGFKEAIATHPASTFLNVAGGLSGVQGIARKVGGTAVKQALSKSTQASNAANVGNVQKAAILQKAKDAGYVIPTSEVNSGFVNNRLEGIAGKAALGQESVLRNQQVTNALSKKALGIPESEQLDINALERIRKEKGHVYGEVANLPNPQRLARGYGVTPTQRISSAKLLESLKQKRNDSQGWYDAYQRSASPDDLKKAKLAEREARSIDAELGNRARDAGRNDLRAKLHEARRDIAKTYSVQKGLNIATGDIDPVVLGNLYKKGKGKVLSGELETIGQVQQAFRKYMKQGVNAQTPGVSKIEAVTSLGLGSIGGLGAGPVGAAVGAALPLMSTPIRNLLLSKMYQKRFAVMASKNPSKALTILDTALSKKPNKNVLMTMLSQENED